MSKEDLGIVKGTPKDDLIRFHFSAGMDIRNRYGLFSGSNKALLHDCKASHPDDASGEIIDALWDRLQGMAGIEATALPDPDEEPLRHGCGWSVAAVIAVAFVGLVWLMLQFCR